MTELKSLILKTMAAAGALLVMTSPASAYEPTARNLQQAAYAFLMGDWDYQFPMEGGETHLFCTSIQSSVELPGASRISPYA